jgi:alpha/beta superfamily hydrolase
MTQVSIDAQALRPVSMPPLRRMVPVTFAGCFGWFHPAAQNTSLAVLLCPPLGREARWVHRSFRKLANQLAASGVPALRFDYPNSGDSCDLPAGDDPLAAWRDSVHIAADWLRAHTGASQLAMVGLRFGALLAAEAAAARSDVAALVLLAPVLSGRAYVRELKALARVSESATDAAPVEMDGLILSDETMLAMSAMAMPGVEAPAPHVLMLEHGAGANRYRAALEALGVAVTARPFTGYAELMRSAVSNRVPVGDIDEIVTWFDGLPRHTLPNRPPKSSMMELRPAGCVEVPLAFGPDQNLFGMLCRPDTDNMPGATIIIGNSGGDPHTGISRFSVVLARRLASQGIASLRMDFAGLGDSVMGPDDREGHLFATDRRADFSAAVDVLAQLGFRQFGAFGLCTGAYHALEAAIIDSRIHTLAMINLPTFSWQQDDPVDLSLPTQFRSSASYRAGLKNWDNWSRLLRGDVAARDITSVLLKRSVHRASLVIIRAAERIGLGLDTKLGRPRRTIRALLRRGVKIQFLLSLGDPGIDTLEAHFGRGGRRLHAPGQAEVTIRQGLDHTLSLQIMRDEAVEIVAGFFGRVTRTE